MTEEILLKKNQNDSATDLSTRPRGSLLRRLLLGGGLIVVGAIIGVTLSRSTGASEAVSASSGSVSRSPSFLASVANTVATSLGDVFGSGSGGQAYEIDLLSADAENVPETVVQGSSTADIGEATNTAAVAVEEKTSTAPAASPVPAKPAVTAPATPAKKTTPAPAPTPKACTVPSASNPSRTIVVNEITWMGAPASGSVSASAASANEWLELKNISGGTIDLYGYRLQTADGGIFAPFTKHVSVAANGFILLERTDDNTVAGISADLIYQGSLSNTGERVMLFDGGCGLVDDVNASSKWPAGDTDTRKTMERNADGSGWHTSANAGGTPRATNSIPAAVIADPTPAPAPTPTSTPAQPAPVAPQGPTFTLTVVRNGDGNGVVQSPDYKVSCGADCTENYAPNTSVTLNAYPENDSVFLGWGGGGCSGTGSCGVLVSKAMTVTASFGFIGTPQTEPVTIEPRYSGGGGDWVEVSEIMAGSQSNSDNEFIELYNPNDTQTILTGWTIKKKSSTGSESVLVPASRLEGKVIPAHGYFLITHEGAYQGSAAADATWASSYNLAYANNSIELFDGAGSKVEEIHWDNIPVGQSWTRSPLSGSTFVAATPTPKGN